VWAPPFIHWDMLLLLSFYNTCRKILNLFYPFFYKSKSFIQLSWIFTASLRHIRSASASATANGSYLFNQFSSMVSVGQILCYTGDKLDFSIMGCTKDNYPGLYILF